MNKKILCHLFVFFLLLPACASSHADDVSEVDAFINDFKTAISEKRLKSILDLNVWTGLPDSQRSSIEKSFEDIINQGILNIKIEYVRNGSSVQFQSKGSAFAPNLPPIAKIYIEINTSKKFRGGYSFYIGKDSGALKFSHVVLKGSS